MTKTPAIFFTTALLCALPLASLAQAGFALSDQEDRYINALHEYQQEADLPAPARQFMVARAHEYGGDLERDDERAQKLYIIAANGGHIGAQKQLVAAHKQNSSGSTPSAKQVAAWEANIKRNEGASRTLPSISEPSQQQALALLEKSAESGHIQAQLQLANTYRRGLEGVKRNAASSKQWYLKAAEQLWPMADRGNPIAASILAELSLQNKGLPYDPELAGLLLKVSQQRLAGNERDAEALDKLERELAPERLARLNATAAQWRPGAALPRDLRQAICTSSDFVQPNFDRPKALAEFADFQARLRKAIDDVSAVEPSLIGETAALNTLRTAFAGTIAAGAKGEALLADFIQPSPRGVVSPLGSMFEKIKGKSCPVGYGGSFTDDGNTVELWYVDLDPADRGALQAFSPAALPAHGSLVRGKFPALVFTRNDSGKLQLYAMSQEMAKVMQYWWGIQLM